MNHQEIRFNILHTLYQKHYSDQIEYPQNTDEIIKEAGLGDIDKDDVAGDIVYLEGKYLIKGEPLIGNKYPLWIKITSAGIEFVEKVIDRFIENIENTLADNDEAKYKVKELSKENNISKRVKSIIEFAKTKTKTNTDLRLDILNIMGLLLRG